MLPTFSLHAACYALLVCWCASSQPLTNKHSSSTLPALQLSAELLMGVNWHFPKHSVFGVSLPLEAQIAPVCCRLLCTQLPSPPHTA